MKRKLNIPSILAANIKMHRNNLSLTQFELAERMDISTTYLAELEIAKKAPSIEVVEKLCKALGIRPYELFLEVGVDDVPNDSRQAVRSYAKEASSMASKAVTEALQDLAKQHLDS